MSKVIRTEIINAAMDKPVFIDSKHYAITYYLTPASYKTEPQDALLIVEMADGSLALAVADGVGGRPHGRSTSKQLLTSIAKSVDNKDLDNSALHIHIANCVNEANQAQIQQANNGQSTLSLCTIHKHQVSALQIGDSGILLFGQRGRIRHKSTRQSVVGYGVEAGMLEEEDVANHPESHVVMNIFGDETMSIEVGPSLEINRYDRLLIASDGLLDNLTSEDLAEKMCDGDLALKSEKLATLINDAHQRKNGVEFPADDDTSFIVCQRRD